MEKLADVEKGAAEAAAQQELVEEGAFSGVRMCVCVLHFCRFVSYFAFTFFCAVANAGITLEAAEKSNSDAGWCT